MTPRDEEILQEVTKQGRQAYDEHTALAECVRQADREGETIDTRKVDPTCEKEGYLLSERDRDNFNHSFLVANYQKKDRKEKQAALFPELEKEIEEGYKSLDKGVQWPNQTAESFKDEICKRADKLYGPKVTPAQRKSFVSRLLCFLP